MRLLVLGGTRFVGRHLVAAALARGYDVTLFHRGRTNPGLFPAAERILGDRAARGVEPWTGLPLWLPTESAGFQKTDNRKAVAAGLSFRLLAETVRDTLAWLEEIGHLPAPPGSRQLTPEGGRAAPGVARRLMTRELESGTIGPLGRSEARQRDHRSDNPPKARDGSRRPGR